MRILHVGASDLSGGAARATYRVHRAIVNHGENLGLQSTLRVIHKSSNDPTVLGGAPLGQNPVWKRLQPRLCTTAKRHFKTRNPVLHSIAWPDSGLGEELQKMKSKGDIDIINLHWIGDSTISIEEIGRLSSPIVWRCPDQWPFLGAEHYTSPPYIEDSWGKDERYKKGYTNESRPGHESGPDLNRRTWLRKCRAWRKPMHIVCTTSWMADCARHSALMHDWPISIIPNPIDLAAFSPVNKFFARQLLGLPEDKPLVLFGALAGLADPRKGSDLLIEALAKLRQLSQDSRLRDLELLVFGSDQPLNPPRFGYPITWLGRFSDDISLRLCYSAADVMVVPSRQESFGQTALEAQACGTPVVAFRAGGPADIVDDRVTGALANPFDTASLSNCIYWVLEDLQRLDRLSLASRERSSRLFNPPRIASLYGDVYRASFESALSGEY